MSLHWADLCQDGVDNLIVVTALGVHILQVGNFVLYSLLTVTV
jgi:hypothetical protein